MIRCVIYARYSSSNQSEISIEAQLRACNDHARQNGYVVVRDYIDRALSATTDNRPAFQEMLADAHGKSFDMVLVHKFDRFARDTLTHDIAKNELLLNDVKLVSVLEPLGDNPESVISESLFKGMAEYYSKNLSREVKKGRNELIKKIEASGVAKHISGRVHFGYELSPTREYIIKEEEAEIIRFIFDMYLTGVGYLSIVRELGNRHYKTPQGKRFDIGAIRDILVYEQYSGVFIINYNPTNLLYNKNRHLVEKRMETIRIENAMPAIISKEIFAEVNKRIKSNVGAGRILKANEPYLLSGLVCCGECGRHMGGRTNGRGLAYYSCNTYSRGSGCSNKNILRDELETVVLDYVVANFNESLIEGLVEALDSNKANYKQVTANRRQELTKTLASLKIRIDNVINEMIEVQSSQALRSKLIELEKQKEYVEKELTTQCDTSAPITLSTKHIVDYINNIADIKNKPRLQQQRLMQSIIHSVVCTDAKPNEIIDSKYIYDKLNTKRIVKVEIKSVLGQQLSVLGGYSSLFPKPSFDK